jgi:CubicO group peptidase (beta-lactamase class C family)
MNEQIPSMLERYHLPGASIALVRNGEMVWTQGYGLVNLETGTPVTPDTVFRLASISKTVTAWAVMRLVEQGKIELDGPVERYLTRWSFPPSAFDSSEVTVSRLLSHTAGLNVHGYGRSQQIDPLPSLEQSLVNTRVQIIQQPGSAFLYSGGGYTVLQLMIEEVTGEDFADYLQSEILDPLGMENSSFLDSPKLLAKMANAYDENGHAFVQRQFREQAAAGLYATAPDLARFAAAGLPGPHGEKAGRGILLPETLERMYTPAPGTGGGYGLGYQTGYDKTPVVMHSGDNPGWETVFVALPEIGEGIVCLTNGDTGEAFNAELIQAWSAWLKNVYASGRK